MKRFTLFFAAVCIACTGTALAEASPGDSIFTKTWFADTNGQLQFSLAEAGKLDSLKAMALEPATITSYYFTIKPTENVSLVAPILPAGGIKVRITVSNKKPMEIAECVQKFSSCRWITGIVSDFQFIGTLKFFYPILPAGTSYEKEDAYTVRLSDTVGIICTVIDNQASMFTGVIMRYTGASDKTGAKINISNAMILETNNSNPFRFGGIAANSLISKWVQFDMSCCGKGYYGLDITGYKLNPSPVVYRPVHKFASDTKTACQVTHDLRGRRTGSAPVHGVVLTGSDGSARLTIVK